MASTGVTWFNGGPNKMAANFSMAADQVDENVEDIVIDALDKAEKEMKDIINAGGINQTKKGGARRLSDDMYNSVEADVTQARGRVTATFGFIDAPFYTVFQERGTKRGIPPMLAFATAYQTAATRIQNDLDSGKWFPTSII